MKIKLVVLLFLLTSYANAQYFEVTQFGLKSKDKPELSYVVIDLPGLKANEIYARIIKYINHTMNDSEASQKGNVLNEYVRYRTYYENFVGYRQGLTTITISADYHTEIMIKDEKIKVEFIGLKMKAVGNPYEMVFSAGLLDGYYIVFKKDGKLFKPEVKLEMEQYFNSQVESLKTALTKNEQETW